VDNQQRRIACNRCPLYSHLLQDAGALLGVTHSHRGNRKYLVLSEVSSLWSTSLANLLEQLLRSGELQHFLKKRSWALGFPVCFPDCLEFQTHLLQQQLVDRQRLQGAAGLQHLLKASS